MLSSFAVEKKESTKKRIEIEHDRFKFFFSIVALLVAGLSGLFIKGFSWVNFALAFPGIVALIGFLAASIRAYSRAEELLKKFEEEEKT